MDVNIVNLTKKGTSGSTKVPLNHNDKIKDIISFILSKLKISIETNRIGLYFTNNKGKKIYLTNKDKTLSSYNFDESNDIIVKDFGTQVDWRFVYIVEYFGPLIIFPLFFFFNLTSSNLTQKFALLMGLVHYGKRIYESICVHKFSRETMPIKNLYINIVYYWLLFGVSCGYGLFNDGYKESSHLGALKYLFAVLFFYFEFKNYNCHMIQKIAKEESNGEYKILPNREGFQYVSCANYFWEFLSWLMFSLFTNSINFYVFTFVGLYVMIKWALEKHSNFKSLFGDRYPEERKAIIPFVI
jgi:very-long-chain enoyl-CoA reductase